MRNLINKNTMAKREILFWWHASETCSMQMNKKPATVAHLKFETLVFFCKTNWQDEFCGISLPLKDCSNYVKMLSMDALKSCKIFSWLLVACNFFLRNILKIDLDYKMNNIHSLRVVDILRILLIDKIHIRKGWKKNIK